MNLADQVRAGAGRVADMVREMIPHLHRPTMTRDEVQLGVFLRGNEPLYDALTAIIETRLRGRAVVQEPSDPVVCKTSMARDGELRWLLNRLETVYRSPVSPQDDGEPPAA